MLGISGLHMNLRMHFIVHYSTKPSGMGQRSNIGSTTFRYMERLRLIGLR